jgi:hypothetical protein
MISLRKDFAHVLLNFNKRYGNPNQSVIAVVEGKDEDYYRPRLAGLTEGKAIFFIDADGKDNVIELHAHLKDSQDAYESNRYVLFADKDYDDSVVDERLYITSRHSVENFYTCPESFRNILTSKFGLTSHDADAEVDVLVEKYKFWMHRVAKETLCFTAWLYWQLREAPKTDGKPPRLNLNGTNLSNFFEIKFNHNLEIEILKKFTLNNAKTFFPYAADSNEERIKEIMEQLAESDFFTYFRGKFIIEVYTLILDNLRTDARKQAPSVFFAKRKNSLVWSNHILAELSSFAETPSCLSKFLRDAFP